MITVEPLTQGQDSADAPSAMRCKRTFAGGSERLLDGILLDERGFVSRDLRQAE